MPVEPYLDRTMAYKPEPVTQRELDGISKIDPANFSIFYHKLLMIAMEGKEIMTRTGATPGCAGSDLNCGIYSAQGDVVMSASGVWGHSLGPQFPIKFTLAAYKDDPGINDGDCWHMTDPYFGATHNNDMETYMPIFYDGELIAWVSAQVHEVDVGAGEMGIAQSVRTRYMDGMYLSPFKIAENFKVRTDLVDMLSNMTRDPRGLQLDMRTRWAACTRMRKRILEVVEKEGVEFFLGGCRKIIDEGASYAARKLSSYLDGTYRDVQFLDTTGATIGLRRVALTFHKKGDKLTIDITGSSPEIPGPFNGPPQLAILIFSGNFFAYTFHDVLPTTGAYANFDFILPMGTLITANRGGLEPVATTAGVAVAFVYMAAAFRCLAKMVFSSPDRDTVCGSLPALMEFGQFAGLDQWGTTTAGLNIEINASGGGGRANGDGLDGQTAIFATLVDSEEAEYFERTYPFVYICRNRGTNNHGFGKFRGGAGLEYMYMIHNTPLWMMNHLVMASMFPCAPGIFGGYQGFVPGYIRIRNSKLLEQAAQGRLSLPSRGYFWAKERPIEGEYELHTTGVGMEGLKEGDIHYCATPGGGGYGDVLEREPEAVIKDLKDSVISPWVAENVYHVAYDPETLVIDHERTQQLRMAEREDRKQRGMKYEEFEKQWLTKKPPEAMLAYFGPWPGELP